MEALWIIVIVLGATSAVAGIGMAIEGYHFNKGKCLHCGTTLSFFDVNSQGVRGYVCDKCGYTTWVSYYFIDKWREK